MNSPSRNTENIVCEDDYEAEKLMWTLSANREQHKLKHAESVGEKEVIVVLDDESSHSITVSDKESASKLQNAINMILFGEKKPVSIRALRNVVLIEIE